MFRLAKVVLFHAATWWGLVSGFGIQESGFELQASYLQPGSHYGTQADGAEDIQNMLFL